MVLSLAVGISLAGVWEREEDGGDEDDDDDRMEGGVTRMISSMTLKYKECPNQINLAHLAQVGILWRPFLVVSQPFWKAGAIPSTS